MDNQVDPVNKLVSEGKAPEGAPQDVTSPVVAEATDPTPEETLAAESASSAPEVTAPDSIPNTPLTGSIMSNSANVTKYSELTTKTIITSVVTCLVPLAALIILIVSIFTSPDLNCAAPRCGYSWASYLTFLLIDTPLSIACIIAQIITKNKFTQLTKIIDKPNTKVLTLAKVSLFITILVLILPLAFHLFTSIGKQ